MSILKVNEIRPRTTGASVDFTVPLGVKSYTTTERDALSSLSAGELIYNSTKAKLEVYNGSSWDTIQNASLTDVTLQDYVETDVALSSSSGVIAIDLENGNTGSITLSENITDIDFTNVPTNGTATFTMKVTQDGTGSRTMAINAITVNGGSNVTGKTVEAGGLTLTTTASKEDIVTFLFFDAGTPFINALLNFG